MGNLKSKTYHEQKPKKDEINNEKLDDQHSKSKSYPLPKGTVPDLELFQNIEVVGDCKDFISNGDGDGIESDKQSLILCPALNRLVAVLNYYNSLMLNAVDGDQVFWQKKFIEFCDKYYGQKWILEDHMHFIANHNDFESTNQIVAVLEYKCFGDLKRCGGTSRHYRNRQRDDEEEVHFYIDIMDSLHFNVLHLVDVGLRVNINRDLENQQSEGLNDTKLLKMKREIQLKRQQTAFPRLDETSQNSKFSLCSTVHGNDGAKGGITKMDSVLKDFQKEVGDEVVVHRLVEFMEEQRYDTETMNEDMAVYAESKRCNVRKAMEAQGDGEGFGAIRRLLRYHRVSGSSFSTGIWWAYWPWYRTQTIEGTLNSDNVVERCIFKNVDFGGHSMESLCVYPHFETLKEEALGSALISAQFWTKLLEKASRYLQSSHCKKMVDRGNGYLLKFGIPKGFKVTVHHLVALLLYTDSSKYCNALSQTFRAVKSRETIEEMNQRNSLYYWTSRYLRELVACFGVRAYTQNSPFFTGISYEMNIPQFQIGLVGPTSTSMAVGVALRFAGDNGTLIVLKGGDSRCFDASLFSAYPEEQECIFCGSIRREIVTSVILVNSAKNYIAAIGAYSKFDAIFSGQKLAEMTALEIGIITETLRWIENDEAVNYKKLDLFILETFYSFIIHKKMVYLNLGSLYQVKDKQIINIAMNPLWNMHSDHHNKPVSANLMRPFVFTLFQHARRIRIDAHEYPFNLILFLRMTRRVDIPQSLDLIIVEGGWIAGAFSEKVQEEYATEGIIGKKQRVELSKQRATWSLMLEF